MSQPGEHDVGTDRVDDVEVTIQIDDEFDPAHQEAIRASVATLAKRSAQASRRAARFSQAQAELSAALTRPIRDLIEAQPDVNDAVTAAAAAAQRELDEQRSAVFSADPEWLEMPMPRPTFASPGGADQVFALPFPAQWEWHNGPRPPDKSEVDKTTGRIELRGHSREGGYWTEAHAGFGVTLTSPRLQAVVGRALRRTQHRYYVYASVLGAVATVEGGTELTVLEDGNLITSAVMRDRRFRKRVSNGESDWIAFDGWETGPPIEVTWVMRPGHIYTFNVDGWVYNKSDGGALQVVDSDAELVAQYITLTAQFT